MDLDALRKLKEHFEDLHPDMTTFAGCASFNDTEGSYKRALVERAAEIMNSPDSADHATLGTALLELVAGRAGLFSNLIDWRAMQIVDKSRAARPGLVEFAVGKMVRNGAGPDEVMAFVESVWQEFVVAGGNSKPYAESRMVPTMIAALVNPDDMLGIRSSPTNHAHKRLFGEYAFGNNPLTGAELDKVLAMARQIFTMMRDEWGWQPRDLWDVQGFIWETCQKTDTSTAADSAQDEIEEGNPAMPSPTNLILYGPPGTGKTYTTACEAVRLCDGEADYGDDAEGRAALMARYAELQLKGRIGFVTFHQNFSYEDFVEGLRPITDASDEGEIAGAGFSLEPQDGIFKQIADLAASNKGWSSEAPVIDRTGKVFKMSLGRARSAEDDVIFQNAIRDGYVVLGWGGDVDWGSPQYETWDAIKQRWRQDHPEASGNDPNMSQMYTFRIAMQPGSLVVISDGNRKFRAIGEIIGPYQFIPGPNGEYNHRRSVRWLWHSDESLPRQLVYDKELSQVSAYQLNSRYLKWEGLEQVVSGGGGENSQSGNPEPHVLIIDEINRANISKVFGELITLIEPDKRLGMTNTLTVTLPYSKKSFGVPANLHIIGTMNTADRSIALLDTALRRRFTFREIAPDPTLLGMVDGIDLAAVLTTINLRIEFLVDREHRIGHAFFMGCKTRAAVDAVMRDKVIPLLQEYFFEDWKQIWAVLGDGFIKSGKIPPPPGFADLGDRPCWSVRGPFSIDAYAKLMAGKASDQPEDAGDAPSEETGESE